MNETKEKEAGPLDLVDSESTWLEAQGGASTLSARHPKEALPAPEKVGHFKIGERLGAGGFGVVYRAVDDRDGAEVALKLLHRFDSETALALKDEFRALSALRHKNLIKLLEVGLDGGLWYFTMELVEGQDILSFIQGESNSSLNFARLRMSFAQLALAIDATHAAGLLHLDIKPNNVLVTSEGRVVLLDFGLVASLVQVEEVEQTRIVGTPTYMAPEQIRGGSLTPATDWYAFGGLLYQLLSGGPAFAGTASEVVVTKVSGNAKPKALPPFPVQEKRELGELAIALLNPIAEARPLGAFVQQALRLEKEVSTESSPRFIGRDKELLFLQSAAQLSQKGKVLAKICGPSGIGKSTLLHKFLAQVRSAGDALVLHSRCLEQAEFPYRAFDAGIDELTRLIDKERLSSKLAPGSMEELAMVFPSLAKTFAPQISREETQRKNVTGDTQQAAFSELIEVLGLVSRARPIILVFDDLQWSDQDSKRLLLRILNSPHLDRLLVVAAYRSDLAPGPVVAALPSPLRPFQGLTSLELELASLSPNSSLELAESLLGGKSDPAASLVARRAAGNPLLLEELAQRQRTEGLLSHPTEEGDYVEVESLILGALARLPLSARRIAELAAVAGRPLSLELAQEALESNETNSELLATVEMLRRARLLSSEEALEPFHARTRAGILSQLHPEALRTRHASLARAYESLSVEDPSALARHHRGALNLAKAAHYATLAGRSAENGLAFGQAAEFYAQAISDLKDTSPEKVDELQRSLAKVEGFFGRGRQAGEAYLLCSERKPSDEKELRALAASHFLNSGELELGSEVYGSLLSESGLTFPKGRKGGIALLLLQLLKIRLRGTKISLRPTEEIPEETRSRIDLLVLGWRGYANSKPIVTGYLALSALNQSLQLGYERGIIDSLDYYGLMGAYVGTAGEAKRGFDCIAQVTQLSQKSKDPLLRARIGLAHGVASSALGNFYQAVSAVDETYPRLEPFPSAFWELSVLENTRCQALFWLGQFLRTRERVDHLIRRAEQSGDVFSTLMGSVLDSMLLLGSGEVQLARSRLDEALQLWTTDDYTFQLFFALKTYVWLDLYEEDSAAALQRLLDDEPKLKASGLMSVQLVQAEFLFLQGVVFLARAHDEGKASSAKAKKCSQKLMKIGRPYTLGYAGTLRTGLAKLRGDDDNVKSETDQASEHFQTASMLAHSAAIRLSVDDTSERAFLKGEGVANPEQWCRIYQPV